jgi:predicted esterase YcpF (UPF0227 family)
MSSTTAYGMTRPIWLCYSHSQQYVTQGSDHGITDFADHVHVLKSFINAKN